MKPFVLALLIFACASCAREDGRRAEGSAPPPPSPRNDLFVTGEPCADQSIEDAPTGCATRVKANLDGRGPEEEILLYARLDAEGYPRSWHVALDDDDGLSSQRRVAMGSDVSYPRLIGATDVNRDGREEVFAVALEHFLHGAVTQDVALLVLTGGKEIERVRLAGEGALKLTNLRFARLAQGARCKDVVGDEGRELVSTRVWSVDRQNRTWRWSRRFYSLDGEVARFVERRAGKLHVSGYNDPALDAFFNIRCDNISVP